MHSLSEAYRCRPSSLLEIETDFAAWQIDEICLMAGRAAEKAAVENSMQFSGSNGQFGAKRPQKFRSMRGMATRKVTVKPDGTWN